MNLFKKTSSHWVRYDKYEWKKNDKDVLYITPAEKAKPGLYNPLKDSGKMVLDAINTGVICMNKDTDEQTKQDAVMDFVSSYGLLGFMTALSTTPNLLLMKLCISQRTISSKRKAWRQSNTCLTSFPLASLIL